MVYLCKEGRNNAKTQMSLKVLTHGFRGSAWKKLYCFYLYYWLFERVDVYYISKNIFVNKILIYLRAHLWNVYLQGYIFAIFRRTSRDCLYWRHLLIAFHGTPNFLYESQLAPLKFLPEKNLTLRSYDFLKDIRVLGYL